MHERGIRFERGQRVADERQILVFDLDQPRGGRCGARIARDHQRDPVAGVAHALAAEELLVGVDQAVAVIRNVCGAQHGHDAGVRGGAADIQPANRGVRAVREDGLAVQHPGPDQIRRILRGPGDLSARIGTGDRAADSAHARVLTGTGSCSFISRAAACIASRILR